jgi:hypothetical protein
LFCYLFHRNLPYQGEGEGISISFDLQHLDLPGRQA